MEVLARGSCGWAFVGGLRVMSGDIFWGGVPLAGGNDWAWLVFTESLG